MFQIKQSAHNISKSHTTQDTLELTNQELSKKAEALQDSLKEVMGELAKDTTEQGQQLFQELSNAVGSIKDDIANSTNSAKDEITSWSEYFWNLLPDLFVAASVLIAFYFISKYANHYLSIALNRFSKNTAVNRLITSFSSFVIFFIGFSIALSILGLNEQLSTILTGAGLVGILLGFSFQDIAMNLISGVVLSFKQPFKINDFIESNGYFGKVKNMNFRAVSIENLNGQIVVIPNKQVVGEPILNFTQTGRRKINLRIGVAYGSNLEEVKNTTIQTIKKLPSLAENMPVSFFYEDFADSSINFVVQFWINFKHPTQFFATKSQAIISIHDKFNDKNITIPFPIRTLIEINPDTPAIQQLK